MDVVHGHGRSRRAPTPAGAHLPRAASLFRDRRGPTGELARAGELVRWLDRRFVDPILGLVFPGGGDLLGAGLGLYLVVLALRLRAPKIVVARMLLNLALDNVVGTVPLLGDLFDFGFRANVKNLRLLEERMAEGDPRPRGRAMDWLVVALAIVAFVATLAAPILLLVAGIRALAR
jgi:hypothetical protein